MLSISQLSLGATVPAVPATLEAAPNMTTDLHETFPMSKEAQIFHIGANKAGTTSMWLYYTDLPGEWSPCHDMCPPEDSTEWATLTHNHNKESKIWHNHRAFMDNGDVADFEWLYKSFPKSRFVMNVRSLKDWMVSRYDMVREIRLGGGCSATGTHGSCHSGWYKECAPQPIFSGSKCLRSKQTWTGNSDSEMRAWIMGLAETQKKQLKFFKQSHAHMNRVVMADFCADGRVTDSLQRLAWIQRKNLDDHRTEHFVGLEDELPYRPPLHSLPSPHHIPHMLSDPHPSSSETHIKHLLKKWGCGDHMDDHLYIDCAEKMKKKGLDFAELPAEPFPSSHHWFIHARNLTSLPDGVEVVAEESGITADAMPSPAA